MPSATTPKVTAASTGTVCDNGWVTIFTPRMRCSENDLSPTKSAGTVGGEPAFPQMTLKVSETPVLPPLASAAS